MSMCRLLLMCIAALVAMMSVPSQAIEADTLVTYAYAEPERHTLRSVYTNVMFFFKHGILDDPKYQFMFVLNGCYSIKIPVQHNVHVLERPNTCWDSGAWYEGLLYMEGKGYTFSKFVFLNASVRGPFIPTWIANLDWIQAFTHALSATVKLVGTSFNCHHNNKDLMHVQSMCWATDTVGLEIHRPALAMCKLLNGTSPREDNKGKPWDVSDAIINGEEGLSQSILRAGYGITSYLLAYRGINSTIFLDRWEEDVKPVCLQLTGPGDMTDVYYADTYGGISVHPLEVMFFKANRDVLPKVLARYTKWFGVDEHDDQYLLPKHKSAGIGCEPSV